MPESTSSYWQCSTCGTSIPAGGSDWCERCLALDRSSLSEPWDEQTDDESQAQARLTLWGIDRREPNR